MNTLNDVILNAERLWPIELSEKWDSIGLVSGDLQQEINSIIFCVDPTHEVIDEAIEDDVQLIIAHHPLWLKDSSVNITQSNYKGSLVRRLINKNIALYTAHTNADAANSGVSTQLIEACGVKKYKPISSKSTYSTTGLGRVGLLNKALPLNTFVKNLLNKLPKTACGIKVAGRNNKIIKKVAVCGGAGGALLNIVSYPNYADVYVTSDLRHHTALEVRQESSIALVDIPHSAGESLWTHIAARQFAKIGYKTYVSEYNSDPWHSIYL